MEEEYDGAFLRDNDGSPRPQEHSIITATKKLQDVIHNLALSTMLALLLLVIYEYDSDSLGLWVIYLVLLLGQAVGLLQVGRCVYIAVQPLVDFDVKVLVKQSRRDRSTWTRAERERWDEAVRWQNEHSELLSLLQKTILGALWIFLILICVVCAEMIALWGDNGYAWIIPLYAIVGIRLFNAILCLSMPLMEIASWVLALFFLIFFNIMETVDSTEFWSWATVSIPLYCLIAGWLIFTGYTLIEYLSGVITMRTRQVEALVLYLLSFSLLIACIAVFDVEVEAADRHGASSLILFFGAGLLFIGVHISTMEALDTLVKRRGAFRPLSLTHDSEGSWVVDEASPRYNILIGEFDVQGATNRRGNVGEDDSCLLRNAHLFLQTLDRVLLVIGVDCLGFVDDSKGRREKSVCAACCDEALCACGGCCGGGIELQRHNSSGETTPMLGQSSA